MKAPSTVRWLLAALCIVLVVGACSSGDDDTDEPDRTDATDDGTDGTGGDPDLETIEEFGVSLDVPGSVTERERLDDQVVFESADPLVTMSMLEIVGDSTPRIESAITFVYNQAGTPELGSTDYELSLPGADAAGVLTYEDGADRRSGVIQGVLLPSGTMVVVHAVHPTADADADAAVSDILGSMRVE